MSALKENIIERLDTLPESALQEVLEFVTFLAWKAVGAETSLLAVAGHLSGEPISGDEVEKELYGDSRQ